MKFNKLAWCLGLLFAASACLAQVNPVPLINQPLVPAAIAPGGSDFILTVNGTGFVPGSVVFWNGSPRKTTFISGSRLTAAIRASDIATDGTAFVTVASPSPGGGNSNVEFFQITNPQSSISFNMTDYTVGHAPEFLVTADFNGDGTLDLATSNISDNTVSILLGRGDGTFQLPTTYQAGGEPITIAAADFNNDGKADLAVVNYCPGFPLCGPATVSIFIGTGDGTFQPQMTYPVALHPGAGLVVADFNGDGNLDLVTTSSSRSTVGILLGNGNGTFQPELRKVNPQAIGRDGWALLSPVTGELGCSCDLRGRRLTLPHRQEDQGNDQNEGGGCRPPKSQPASHRRPLSGRAHRPDEAISASRQGLNKSGIFGIIIQGCSKPLHGIVQPLLEVHKGVGGPQPLLKFFSGNDFPGALQQQDQNLDRLPLDSDLHSIFAEFPRLWVELEQPKAEGGRYQTRVLHNCPRAEQVYT